MNQRREHRKPPVIWPQPVGGVRFNVTLDFNVDEMQARFTPEQIKAVMAGMATVLAVGKEARDE